MCKERIPQSFLHGIISPGLHPLPCRSQPALLSISKAASVTLTLPHAVWRHLPDTRPSPCVQPLPGSTASRKKRRGGDGQSGGFSDRYHFYDAVKDFQKILEGQGGDGEIDKG